MVFRMTSQMHQYPNYDLYGESGLIERPGAVHLEDISTRSESLDWVIKPHRHAHLFQVLYILDGQANVTLNKKTFSIRGKCAVTIPMGVVHGFTFQPNIKGFVLSVTSAILGEEMQNAQDTAINNLFHSAHVFQEDSQQFNRLTRHFIDIRDELKRALQNQEQSLLLLTKLVLLTLQRLAAEQQLEYSAGPHEARILTKFKRLIEEHYLEHWPLSKYASELFVSMSSLNRLCNKNLGESPKNIIQRRLIDEAKRKLVYTQQPIQDLCYSLGFKDYPYFSRFFKKHIGMTAGCYRQSFQNAPRQQGKPE